MILRFVDGFDVPFPPDNVALKYVATGSVFAQMITGRYGGFAYTPINTGFGQANKTVVLGSSDQAAACFDLQPRTAAIMPVQFLRFQHGSVTQIALQLKTDGRIEVRRGGTGMNNSGTIIATSTAALTLNQWKQVRVKIEAGAHGSILIKFDQTTVVSETNINTDADASGIIDRVTHRWEALSSNGLAIDNYHLWTGVAGDTHFPDRARVTTWLPNGDAAVAWTRNGGSSNYGRLVEVNPATAPDGDTTYNETAATGAKDLFTLPEIDCFGLNLGVAWNADLKIGIPGTSQTMLICRADPGTAVDTDLLTTPAILTASYRYVQGIRETSPLTGIAWTDREIGGAWWGVRHVSGLSRLSSLYLEKLTSLEDVPYDCGVGSYAF